MAYNLLLGIIVWNMNKYLMEGTNEKTLEIHKKQQWCYSSRVRTYGRIDRSNNYFLRVSYRNQYK